MSLRDRELFDVVEELAALLPGSRLEKVNDPHPLACQLVFREHILLLDLTPGMTRLHLIREKLAVPPTPPAWVMKARREIQGLVLGAVRKEPGDRSVRLIFRPTPVREERTLLAELFGKRARLLLLGPDDQVLFALIGQAEAGAVYWPPPARPGRGPGESRFPAPDPSALAVNRAVEAFFFETGESRSTEDGRRELLALIEKGQKRLSKKIVHLEEDLARASEGEKLRRCGEALKAHLAEVPKGAHRIELPDPFDPQALPLAISLDPALPATTNMQRLFTRARRLVNACPRIRSRLAEARLESAQLGDLHHRAEAAADAEALTALRASLHAPTGTRRKQRRGPRLPYHTYQSATGRTILVGRSGKDNHALTFRVAKGHDLWLHVRDSSGAHVVVPRDRAEDIDEQTLLDAATLAALSSPQKNSSRVEVTYTEAKNVHPLKGVPPGTVSVARSKTIAVRMEPDRVRRILETKDN